MCVICCKPHNVPMPTEETLSNMWVNNPDGAGFMYAKDGKVFIEKGFMTYDAFSRALDELRSRVDLDKASLILHFRITTHGGTKPENCHPFPVTDSVGLLKKRKTSTKLGVAHNGIISITPRKGISDTMEYIVNQLGPLQKAVPKFYKDPNLMKMISNAIDSKMAFMNGDGKIYTIGNFVEEGGIKYSNGSYKAYRWSKSLFDYYDECAGWQSYTPFTTTSFVAGQPGDCNGGYAAYAYAEKALMWLDDSKGDFIVDDKGNMKQGDYAIDCNQNVFEYSDSKNCMHYRSGYTAYNSSGNYLKYDHKSENLFFEYTYGPTTWKGKNHDGK